MPCRKLTRRSSQFRRTEIGRRRIDPVARHAQCLGGMRYEIRIRISRRFEGGGIVLHLPVAIKTVCGVQEAQRELGRFGCRKILVPI